MAVPPSTVRPFCAHFAEVLVKAHHVEILKEDAFILSPELISCRESFIERHGCSSPHLPWEKINDREDSSTGKLVPGPSVSKNFLRHVESKDVLAVDDLIVALSAGRPRPFTMVPELDETDPSVYVSMDTAWEIIMRADQCMRHIHVNYDGTTGTRFLSLVDKIVANAISSISDVGAPSWGLPTSFQVVDTFWQKNFPATCNEVLDEEFSSQQTEEVRDLGGKQWILTYARLSMLRAAYYTIMMRAAPEIGPGLTEDSKIDTALAYMA